MNAPVQISFEDEARQLAEDEHFDLANRIEMMHDDCDYTAQDIYWFKRDYGFRDDPADYYAAHREHFLEKAREQFAESAL